MQFGLFSNGQRRSTLAWANPYPLPIYAEALG
jgi:hypothetical protein